MEPNRRKTDLSPEQKDLVCNEADRMLKHYARGAVAAYVFIVLICVYLYVEIHNTSDRAREQIVRSGNVVAVDACNRDFRDREALRDLLVRAKRTSANAVKQGLQTQERHNHNVKFYDDQLKRQPLPDCRHAINVLTDDPDKKLIIPKALYPAPSQETRGDENHNTHPDERLPGR